MSFTNFDIQFEKQFEKPLKKTMRSEKMILNKKQQEAYDLMLNGNSIFLTGMAGTGKCLGINTPILMFDGSIKKVQDVVTGDLLMGDDSTPRTVLSTATGIDWLYKIKTKTDEYIVNSEHILTFTAKSKLKVELGQERIYFPNKYGKIKICNQKLKKEPELIDISLKNLLKNKPKVGVEWSEYFHSAYATIEFEDKETEIDPYDYGYQLDQLDLTIKEIPLEYKANSRQKRLELFAGIIDRFGELNESGKKFKISGSRSFNDQLRREISGSESFENYNIKRFFNCIIYVAKSLGFISHLSKDEKIVHVDGSIKIIPNRGFYLAKNSDIDSSPTFPITIKKLNKGEYFGFEIDGNRRFVLGNFIITHNTALIKKLYEENCMKKEEAKIEQHGSFSEYFQNKSRYKNMGLTSTTGTSALIIGGTTLHSFTGIRLGTGSAEALTNTIRTSPKLRKRWKQLEVLIIDEVSMLSPVLFDKLEQIARSMKGSVAPFGGIQLILTGDFLQLPCVEGDKFCFESEAWKKCIKKTVYLEEIVRQSEVGFRSLLNKIRLGVVDEEVKKLLLSRVNKKLENDLGIIPTKIYPLKVNVDQINEIELDKFSDQEFFEYNMEINVFPIAGNKVYAIEKFRKGNVTPENLQLAVGVQVMLTWNLDLLQGLANGSRGIVTEFVEDFPKVKFLNGIERIIKYNTWSVEEDGVPIMEATQIPLRIAYAITIHKCQGATLDYAEVDLENVFEYGQAYVALSRVKSFDGLSIGKLNFNKIVAHPEAIRYYKNLISN
jgi:ATP-dependent DNA helicase PIF1